MPGHGSRERIRYIGMEKFPDSDAMSGIILFCSYGFPFARVCHVASVEFESGLCFRLVQEISTLGDQM